MAIRDSKNMGVWGKMTLYQIERTQNAVNDYTWQRAVRQHEKNRFQAILEKAVRDIRIEDKVESNTLTVAI